VCITTFGKDMYTKFFMGLVEVVVVAAGRFVHDMNVFLRLLDWECNAGGWRFH
jgi:hypothetical protein